MWTIAGSLAQTVFDAGMLQNRQAAAEAAAAQAVEQYRGVVLAAFRNVADVLRALQADARAIDAAVSAERSSSRYIELVRKQVELGQVNIATLITAQQAYLQSSLARVDAQAARLSDTVALFQALGGGWWNRIDPLTGELPANSPLQQNAPEPQ
jgi:outer membrane protein TolC